MRPEIEQNRKKVQVPRVGKYGGVFDKIIAGKRGKTGLAEVYNSSGT